MEHYRNEIKAITHRLQDKANEVVIDETFGQKDYQTFRKKLSAEENLSIGERAVLCMELADMIEKIKPQLDIVPVDEIDE